MKSSYPSPRYMVCECTTKQRTKHRSYAIGGANITEQCGSLFWSYGDADHREDADANPSTSNACDRTSDDQRHWVLCHCAYKATDLEDEHSQEEPQLDGKILVGFTEAGLETGECHEVGGSIPMGCVSLKRFGRIQRALIRRGQALVSALWKRHGQTHHETLLRSLNSSVILGMAVLKMVYSNIRWVTSLSSLRVNSRCPKTR